MTKEEAYTWLQNHFPVCDDGTKQDEAIKIALDVLSKQIPMLPVQPKECVRYGHGYDYHDYYCPSCGGFLAFEPEGDRLSGQSRCPYCGQIISWDIITEGWDELNK